MVTNVPNRYFLQFKKLTINNWIRKVSRLSKKKTKIIKNTEPKYNILRRGKKIIEQIFTD
jgi:hypothetical protein